MSVVSLNRPKTDSVNKSLCLLVPHFHVLIILPLMIVKGEINQFKKKYWKFKIRFWSQNLQFVLELDLKVKYKYIQMQVFFRWKKRAFDFSQSSPLNPRTCYTLFLNIMTTNDCPFYKTLQYIFYGKGHSVELKISIND